MTLRENSITRGNLANALKAQGRIDDALAEYVKVLKVNPRDAIVYYNLANLYRDHRNDPENAIINYNKAVGLQPKFAEAWLNLGLLYARTGNVDRAIDALQSFSKFAEKNDKNKDAVMGMIVQLSQQRQLNSGSLAPKVSDKQAMEK